MAYSVDSDNLPDRVKAMAPNMKKLWVRTHNSVTSRGAGGKAADTAADKMCRTAKAGEDGDLSDEIEDTALESFVDAELAPKPTREFLQKLASNLKGLVGKQVTDEDVTRLVRSSAGYVGGSRPKKKAAAEGDTWEDELYELAELAATYSEDDPADAVRLFYELSFADAPEYINVLPVPGTYKHPAYGSIKITKERNANFVDNFNAGIYQEKVPIDAEHQTKLSGAVGWMTELRQNTDGSVDAKVEWTDRGTKAIEDESFKYFSPEWYDTWLDPINNKTYKDVLIGGALTTRPFFKEKALKPLVASELRSGEGWQDANKEFKDVPSNISFDDIRYNLQRRLRERYPLPANKEYDGLYITDVFSDYFIFCRGDKNFMCGYDVDNMGGVTLAEQNEEQPVERMTMWRAIKAAENKTHDDKPATIDSKQAKEPTPQGVKTVDEQQFNEKVAQMESQIAELKSASETAIASQAAAEAARVAAESRVAVLEAKDRHNRFADIVKGGTAGHRWYGELDTHISMLETLATTFGEDSDQFKNYVSMNEASAKQLHESNLFSETGTSKAPSGETSQFSEALRTYREANPGKTEAEAMTAVLEANPQLYSEYQRRLTRNAMLGNETKV